MLHAGQYLLDKELCYLRTVIVTANVYFKKINTGYTSIPIRMKLTYRELCFCYPVIWSNISFSLNYTLICQVNNTDFTWTLKHITSNHSYAQSKDTKSTQWLEYRPLGCNTGTEVPNDQSNPSITPSHLTWGIDSKLTYPELIISFWQCWLIRTTIAYSRYHSDAQGKWGHIFYCESTGDSSKHNNPPTIGFTLHYYSSYHAFVKR